jgi:hypothetical protein
MKKQYLFFGLVIISCIFSCNRTKKKEQTGKLPYAIEHMEVLMVDSLYYQIDIQQPRFVSEAGADLPIAELNAAIQQFLDTATTYFWGTDTTGARQIIDETGASGYFILMNRYFVKDTTEHMISLMMESYSYALGAHGFTAITTFNYDLIEGRLLELSDFVDLSTPENMEEMEICLVSYLDDPEECFSMLPGVDADFKRFAVSPENLIFYYEAYELGAYSCGNAEISVPIEELKTAGLWIWEK